MKATRWVYAGCVLVTIASALLVSCTAQRGASTNTATSTSPEAKVARGRYLVITMGCGDCHTPGGMFGAPDTSRLLSGSELGWSGPWGTTYARNLTPHPTTGIGSWTEEQIVSTIRTGHRPDGQPLMPPMPWQDFSILTDDDAFAIAAYLKSVPPVDHKVPDKLPPGAKPQGSYLAWPAPATWDVPHPAGPPDTTKH